MSFINKHLVKLAFFSLLIIVASGFFINYFSGKNSRGGKAATGEQLQLNFIPDTVTPALGSQFKTTMQLVPLIDMTTNGYEYSVPFDQTKLQVTHIAYLNGSPDPTGDTDANLAQVNSSGVLHIMANFPNAGPGGFILQNGVPLDLIDLTFTSASNLGSTTTIDYSLPHYFSCASSCTAAQVDIIAGELLVNGGAAVTPGPSITPCLSTGCIATATPAITPCLSTGCVPTVTPIITPCISSGCVPTVTPTVTGGNVTLNMRVKFQGITSANIQDPTQCLNSLVQVTGASLTQPIAQTVCFKIDPSANNGTWTGSMLVTLPPDPTANAFIRPFSVYIKGPKHLQKRICDSVPKETSGGIYHCSTDGVGLSIGQNDLNFSGILLLAGDLPITNGAQDGLIDSQDTTYIRQNFGSSDSNVLSNADLNLDGHIDTQDFSLVIAALSVKFDDPVQ